jgi:hypothetical protein
VNVSSEQGAGRTQANGLKKRVNTGIYYRINSNKQSENAEGQRLKRLAWRILATAFP